jgi:hypothetical protein
VSFAYVLGFCCYVLNFTHAFYSLSFFFGAVVWSFDLVAFSVSVSGRCYCVVSFYGLWSEHIEILVLGDCVSLFELPALFAEVSDVD